MKEKIVRCLACLQLAALLAATASAGESGGVQPVYDAYLKIQITLASDSIDGIADNAMALSRAVRDDPSGGWSEALAPGAETLAGAKDLETARAAFKPLSQALIVHWAGHPAEAAAWQRFYCPMAKAAWLQKENEAVNPYMGKAMLHCGSMLGRAASGAAAGPHAAEGANGCPAHGSMDCGSGEAGCCMAPGK
jgi:Cu(I)/Ag(I) efflux system membrane fusion protein